MKTALSPARHGVPSVLFLAALLCMLASCSRGGGDGGGVITTEKETIKGQVIDGYISGALVCLDLNGSGRCDASEPQALTDATGAYQFEIPKNSAAPLVAEIVAGRSRDSDQPDGTVDTSFRMASPSRNYSTIITPFTTLVHLTAVTNFPLAEDLVRNEVGLPPRFDIALTAPAAPESLTGAVAKSIVTALKATGNALDWSAPGALKAVVVAFPPALTVLPQVQIRTKNEAPIVSKEVYVDATFTLINPAAAIQQANLNGRIRGRGHTTWGQPKNPYKVQFTNDAAYASVADFFGMKKNRNWALLADYFDMTLLRNKLVLSLGSSSVFTDGLKWNPSGQHVEVWLNGEYVGVYLFTEDIRIASSRLNIKEMSKDAAVNDVDGGYIVEVDFRLDCYNVGALNLQLVTPQNVPFCIDTPDEGAITQAQLAYIKGLLVQVEQDLYGPVRVDAINLTSFVDWYLLQELFKNHDGAFVSSDYMWKDTGAAASAPDRMLNMGPLWDFDASAGNYGYEHLRSAEGCWVNTASQPNWFSRVFDNPEFLALTISRWQQKRPALATFVNSAIDAFDRRLDQAQQRNFDRWPLSGQTPPNPPPPSTHAQDVAFVRQFLNNRMAWLDRAFASPEAYNTLCR
jgi:hypothetical protein